MSVSGVGVSGRGRLVVFDCDGVLVDSERLNVALDVEAIGELGWAITREEVIARHVGLSEADATADIESVIGRPVPAEWVLRWRSAYHAAYETQLEAVPGVGAAIADLVADGWAVCVATSGERATTWRKLARCG
ncbi:MAG TPA: HAD family phosphatase, partial [Dermatophilaceae bacterium]|nr:HAD family phosphatase [Dermatophilaceae bacterium]HQD01412.1 HAD family phosphatase [Dermatophilaceae bacterium]